MPKLRKVTVFIETLGKQIESYSSYSEEMFRVVLGPDYTDYARGMSYDSSYRGKTTISKANTHKLVAWRSSGREFIGTGGTTEAEAIAAWREFITFFYAQAQKVEKLIAYTLSFGSMYVTGNHSYYNETDAAKFERDPDAWREARTADSQDNEASISFDFLIVERRTIGSRSRLFFVDKEGNTDTINERYKLIPYTPEAEAFFSDVYTGLESIMEKLSKFIGTTKRAEKAIQSSQKLLA